MNGLPTPAPPGKPTRSMPSIMMYCVGAIACAPTVVALPSKGWPVYTTQLSEPSTASARIARNIAVQYSL